MSRVISLSRPFSSISSRLSLLPRLRGVSLISESIPLLSTGDNVKQWLNDQRNHQSYHQINSFNRRSKPTHFQLLNAGLKQQLRYFSTTQSNMSYGSKAAERLAGKTILITGASAGIGKDTAYEFASAANGAVKLVLTARRLERLEEIKADLESKYKDIKVLVGKLDVSKPAEVTKYITELPEEFKEIDVLVNNAGMVHGVEKVGDIAQEDIDIMFDTNVRGLIAATQAVLPGMKKRNRGDIINLGSIAGRDPYPSGGIYCATKAAVRSFSHSLRKELIDTRIRVIEVQPGQVETEFSIVRFRGDTEAAKNVYKGAEPLIGQDIAEIIVFAATRRENTVIAETLVFPTHQASATHVYKRPE